MHAASPTASSTASQLNSTFSLAHCLQQRPFAFSDPFIMRIGAEETVGELRQRVKEQLGIPDEEFETSWKPVLCT